MYQTGSKLYPLVNDIYSRAMRYAGKYLQLDGLVWDNMVNYVFVNKLHVGRPWTIDYLVEL